MKKPEIAKQMARRTKSRVGEAADCLDSLVRQIVANLREGKETRFPGLGDLTRDGNGKVVFRAEGDRRRD